MRREREREREREPRTAKIYTRLRYIFRELYFLALPLQGWHKADLKHLIIFVSSPFWIILACTCRLFSTSLPGTISPSPGQRITSRVFALYSVSTRLTDRRGKLASFYIFQTPSHFTNQHPTNAIHMVFALSFVYLNTLLHFVFEIHELTRPVKGQYITFPHLGVWLGH